jgi:hypothetical protein
MIKRPLNPRFRAAVLNGIKRTTIRDKAWPIGVPIMLYSWSGKPMRSPHDDLAPVIVEAAMPVHIHHKPDGDILVTKIWAEQQARHLFAPLWEVEGFASRQEFDAWFRPLIKPGTFAQKHLMLFRLANARDALGQARRRGA